MGFNKLQTEQFRKRITPHIDTIYRQIWTPCLISRHDGNTLDAHYGIDVEIQYKDTIFTLQEKIRENTFLTKPNLQVFPPWPDFTQEYKNGVGTRHEREGEWFHLAAQLYWYGWSNKNETSVEKWILLDVVKYKQVVLLEGGLDVIGTLMQNKKHGSASFYGISIRLLGDAIAATYLDYKNKF